MKMAYDRVAGIDFDRLREYRLRRTKEAMAEAGIDVMITWDAYSIRYICGGYPTVPCRFPQAQFVVLPINGDPHCFLTTSFSCKALRKEMPWLKNKVWSPPGGLKWARNIDELEPHMAKIIPILEEHGQMNGVIALDGCCSEMMLKAALERKGVTRVVHGEECMFKARIIKNEDEIELMRITCNNATAAFYEMKKALIPGVRECDLVGVGMKALYELGADEVQEFVCSSGPRTNPLHIDYTDRMINPGDVVCIDVNGNSYMGYKSCYYRTFVCGQATQLQRDVYEACRAMMYAGMERVKAGNSTADIAAAWPQTPQYWGCDNWLDAAGYALGHGLGLSLHEAPTFFRPYTPPEAHTVLEEGMVMAVETWTGGVDPTYGPFGVRLEEDIVVTKDGYELLTKFPVDTICECGI